MALKNYNPKLVLCTLGAIPISGFADGTFLKIERKSDAFNQKVGADGESCRTRTNDNSAKISVTLMQSSASNDLLSAQHSLDKALPAGLGTSALLIKDLSGRTLFEAAQAWIVKEPDQEFGKEAADREWVIETDNLIGLVGGN